MYEHYRISAQTHTSQQVASMMPSSSGSASSEVQQLHPVTSVSIHPMTRKIAWAQGDGVLQLSSMAELQQSAGACQQRAAEAAESSEHEEGDTRMGSAAGR